MPILTNKPLKNNKSNLIIQHCVIFPFIPERGAAITYSYNNIQMETTIDVTNVSNVKLYWQTYSTTATALDGSSTQNRTYATFIRLGDT